MKCIVCDKCKTIIKDAKRCRVITCARPLKLDLDPRHDKPHYRGDDPKTNDILWTRELCSECMDKLEAFFESPSSGDGTDEPVTPGENDESNTPGEEDNTPSNGDDNPVEEAE